MSIGTEALARASARRPWRTVVIWLVLLVTAGLLTSALLDDALTTSITFTDDPESDRALELIDELRGEQAGTEFVVITAKNATAGDPAHAGYVNEVQTALAASRAVAGVGSYLTQDGPVSESGKTVLLPVTLAGADMDEWSANAETIDKIVTGIETPAGFTALVAGRVTLNNDFNTIAEEDLATGETIGIGVALVVLVLVFGTVASGVLPIVLGVVAIGVAMGAAALVGQAFDLSFFVTNMITMIGLAVGIDYSLFIVSRYREERHKGHAKLEAIGRAGATATRAVFFSGLTVVLALVGMLLLPNTLFRSLGLGAILVVVAAVAASVTLLPAVLSLMGDRIEALSLRRHRRDGRPGWVWDRVTGLVMDRPVISLVVSVGILIAASWSFFSMSTGLGGVSTLPADIESARAFEILEAEFAGGVTSPVEVVMAGNGADETAAALQKAIAADGGYGPSFLDPASTDELAILSVQLLGDVASVDSMDAVRHLRADLIPTVGRPDTEVLVGGQTATTVDFLAQTDHYTPIVIAVVLGLSSLLLAVAFRSIVIPGKAIAMNLLSVGAAYGLLVAFFQIGVGPAWMKTVADRLGFTQVETIEAWLPLFLFSVLFGLSMDYHVFLLSRIKERFDQTADNTESVAHGLRSTGALITGAAAIMVAVFSGFAAGQLSSFQQMGFGLAVAVLLDATVVRTVLVPASMKLLGAWNWYFPSWLEWIPKVSVEGHPAEVHGSPEAEPMAA
ncbi:MAG: MMPL family transporter [Acidimicrobiia bacterium]|nr:MMPL family transporter [Acidimicrobiia bacterium]